MKQRIWSFIRMLAVCASVALWFIPFYHGVGHLPSLENPDVIVQVDFYHSAYENLCATNMDFLPFVYFALAACSVALSAVSFATGGRKLARFSAVMFCITLAILAVLLIAASAVARGY